MQELVQQRLTELLDLRSILRTQMIELTQHPLELGDAYIIHAGAQLLDGRDDTEPAIPRPEEVGLFFDDALGGGNLVAAPGGRLGGDRLEIVDIVQEHVLELRDRRIDVARHRQIQNAQRFPATRANDRPHALPRDDRVRRRRRAERNVRRGEVRPRFLQRHGLAAQPLGDRAGALLRAIGDEGDPDALIAETGRRQLGHVTGAKNERVAAREIAKDLARDGDTRRGGGRRSHAEARFGAHARPDVQCRLKQPMQHGTGLRARRFPSLPHLPLDLRFAKDHRVESRRYAIEMADRITVAGDVPVLPRASWRRSTRWEPLTQQ